MWTVNFTIVAGCGKTYAYLLPVLQNILREDAHVETTTVPNSPKAIITVPSHELVTQLGVSNLLFLDKTIPQAMRL